MPTRAAMIVVPYATGAATPSELARACAEFGGVVFVVDERDEQVAATRPVLEVLGRVVAFQAATVRPGSLDGEPVDGIVTFADSTIDMTLDLAEALARPYHSRVTARYVQDKLAQREQLNAAGVGCVPVAEVCVGPDAAPPPAELFPAVVKPRRGSGSEQTVIVPDAASFGAATVALDPRRSYVAERYIPDGAPLADWLANYLSVESVVRGNEVVHLGLTGRLPLAEPARETGLVFPLPVPGDVRAGLTGLAEQAMEALGIRLGVVHTEIKLAPDGPQVIEVNGRLGGRLNGAMAMVGMPEPVGIAVALAAGRPLPAPGVASGAALSFWLQPPREAREVVALPSARELARLPGVTTAKAIRGPGSPVDWRLGTAGLVLEAWLHGADQDELRDRYLAVRRMLGERTAWG
jgi:glutathione synthase/RimK-type ligase-like ATP-grasp enzyme